MSLPDTIETPVPVITVDGPGGSGKGTITTRLAKHLGWHFLDSGALYRLTALAVIKAQVSLDDEVALGQLAANLNIRFETNPFLELSCFFVNHRSGQLLHHSSGTDRAEPLQS